MVELQCKMPVRDDDRRLSGEVWLHILRRLMPERSMGEQ